MRLAQRTGAHVPADLVGRVEMIALDRETPGAVASAVGGIPEVVADGETGLLVPVGDEAALASAVNVLIRDPARAAELGARGRQRAVAEFSWDRIGAQTAELYAELARR